MAETKTQATRQSPSFSDKICAYLLIVLLIFSFFLFNYNNDFPLGLHIDEPHKVLPILEGFERFNHPQLLIDLMKLAHWATGRESPQALVETGRTISSIFGLLLVLFSYLLARRILGPGLALLAAAFTAAVPLISIHAHYLKEDIFLAPFYVGGVWAYLRVAERGSPSRILLLGLMVGLAVSAKFTGSILVVALFCAALLEARGRRKRLLRDVAAATAVGVVLFLAINHVIFFHPQLASTQIANELRHGLQGHTLRIWPIDTAFAHHFLHSLGPGLTWPVAILFVLGIVTGLLTASKFSKEEKIALLSLGLFYFVHEISPTKPFPASIRYMVPIAPLVVIVALRGVRVIADRMPRRWTFLPWMTVALVLLSAALQSALLIRDLASDTRLKVPRIAERHLIEHFAHNYFASKRTKNQVRVYFAGRLSLDDMARRGFRYLVISSFAYDRFLFGGSLHFQRPLVYAMATRYERLLKCPAKTIRARYKSFAFSNPTIRIIDIRKCLGIVPSR